MPGAVEPTSFDAIVVLGCPIARGGMPQGASQRRVAAAARLYHAGVAPWVVASGGCRWHGVSEAEAYQQALARAQVPLTRVMLELRSLSTSQNALFVAQLFRSKAWRRAALVTCDWHMPRAKVLFERAGVECVPMPAPSPPSSLWVRGYRRARERVSLFIDGKVDA